MKNHNDVCWSWQRRHCFLRMVPLLPMDPTPRRLWEE